MTSNPVTLATQVEVSQHLLDGFTALGLPGRRQAGRYALVLLHTLGKADWDGHARQAMLDLTAAVEDHAATVGVSQEVSGLLNAARSHFGDGWLTSQM